MILYTAKRYLYSGDFETFDVSDSLRNAETQLVNILIENYLPDELLLESEKINFIKKMEVFPFLSICVEFFDENKIDKVEEHFYCKTDVLNIFESHKIILV